MTDAESTYWAVVAQTFPVLGLALVLEARTLAQNWQKFGGSTRPERRWQIFFLSTGGLGVAVATWIALVALRLDKAPGEWAHLVLEGALGAALSGTLGSPLITLLMHSESGLVTRIARLPTSWQLYRVLRERDQLVHGAAALRRQRFDQVLRMQAIVARAQASHERVRRIADETLTARAHDDRLRAEKLLDEVHRGWWEMIVHEQNMRLLARETRRVMREWSREEREGVADAYRRASDPVTGLTGTLQPAVHRQAPDDGGFFSTTAPASFAIPKYEPTSEQRLITNTDEFYSPPECRFEAEEPA